MKQTQSAIYTTESEHKLNIAGICIAEMQETIRTQQAEIERLTEQLNVAAEENAKLVSDKYPFAHIRIDCSEYEKDLAIRNKLIELGWTPPAEIEASK